MISKNAAAEVLLFAIALGGCSPTGGVPSASVTDADKSELATIGLSPTALPNERLTIIESLEQDARRLVHPSGPGQSYITAGDSDYYRNVALHRQITHVAETVIRHPESSEREMRQAYRSWRSSASHHLHGNEQFKKTKAELVRVIVHWLPTSDLAAECEAYDLIEKGTVNNQPADADTFLPEVVAFARKYRTSSWALSGFTAYGQALEIARRFDDARRIYEAGLHELAEHSAVKCLDGLLFRLSLIGQPIEVVGPTLEGSNFDLRNLKGNAVVVVFWASWCGPCKGEIEWLQRAYAKYHDDGLEIVGINMDEDLAKVSDFVKGRGINWPQIVARAPTPTGFEMPLARRFKVSVIPSTLVLDRSGSVVATHGLMISDAPGLAGTYDTVIEQALGIRDAAGNLNDASINKRPRPLRPPLRRFRSSKRTRQSRSSA